MNDKAREQYFDEMRLREAANFKTTEQIAGLMKFKDGLMDERDKLLLAIRQHRDERGDDRCHADDARLYAVLPEGDTRPARETAVTLENCTKYIECRQTGREYVSPQRRIEELEAELQQARAAMDPAICRLQFPDGSVPEDIQQCAEGWKRAYDELSQRNR